jgi:pyruvate dehydrogenase E2 component (dihydrolipoamide acetyltransferase)
MARAFALPDLGEGLHEAEIVKVLVSEGEIIAEDAPLLEVETDKAQVEIPSPVGGRVEKVHVRPGQTVHVGDVLVTFSEASRPAATLEPPSERVAPTAEALSAVAPAAPLATPEAGLRVASTPSTRRLARELGVDIRGVRGTGPGGRVTDGDVRATAGAREAEEPRRDREPGVTASTPLAPAGVEPPPLPNFEQWGPIERQPLSHLRRTIAERMALSARLVPHVTHLDRADITDLDALITRHLERARERGVTLTLTSFILKSVALALAEHPVFNASLDAGAGELILKRYCHLGVAVAMERGLIVPVIRDVDRKSIGDLARELARLAARVREGKATLEDLRGGTFTVTNIGALGGTGAIPIINYPEVAILGVARARLEPVVRDGQIVPRLLLPITLTFDHRVADGADGARFAAAILRRLEHPDELLLDL